MLSACSTEHASQELTDHFDGHYDVYEENFGLCDARKSGFLAT
jgi:hypothetical protein